jgi:ParB family transcriptional regulator, chromosome partitioning protein
MPGAAKAKVKRAPRRKRAPKSAGLEAKQCSIAITAELEPVAAEVERGGGCVLATYRDPLGGNAVMLTTLPIDQVQPTPFQRDLSETHHKRLADVIQKTGRFLDPLIAVPAPEKGFWTPNGYHRLEAMRRLGAKAITVLIVPEREIARQILALNTEKAHNLKERALEVIRIYRGLVEESGAQPESSFAFYLEDPSLVTLGRAYEQNPRLAGGAYHPVLKRVESFTDDPVKTAIKTHEKRAAMVMDLESSVAGVMEKLKQRGFESPYLRSFVVARINPLRWMKDEPPPAEEVLQTMIDRARKFNVEKVKQQDLAKSYGAPED